MSELDPTHGESHGSAVVPHGEALPERFPNPGLPPHRPRMTDVDPQAARRAELQVVALFVVSVVGTVVTLWAYFRFQLNGATLTDFQANVKASTFWMGVGMFLALMGIGLGAVHWAKTLMPDTERTELRHVQRGSEADRAAAVAILKEGSAESGVGRRPLIRNALLGAMALFPLPGLVLFRDLGPTPGDKLSQTLWEKGTALVIDGPDARRIKASDLEFGSVVHVLPEGLEKAEHLLDEKAKAPVLLMRLDPSLLSEESRAGSYNGIVAYSKICTHMGCPVALYEQQTHHLLCPCHQSTFDLTKNCEVIFGPAKRALPQLDIEVDAEGYLVARSGFKEPVGPSFWERS
jgi:ubiquinol-cytochrome c reductase iron-sulfur subunit